MSSSPTRWPTPWSSNVAFWPNLMSAIWVPTETLTPPYIINAHISEGSNDWIHRWRLTLYDVVSKTWYLSSHSSATSGASCLVGTIAKTTFPLSVWLSNFTSLVRQRLNSLPTSVSNASTSMRTLMLFDIWKKGGEQVDSIEDNWLAYNA